MITIISGIPGVGKNVYATYLAKKHFKQENNFIRRFIRGIKKEDKYINNIYTTYPVLLKSSKRTGDIYSNVVSLFDLDGKHSFKKNAIIIIDEVQAFIDSDEYKDFPKSIATFNQFHRHFDISSIYYISQHPSRVAKKLRNVTFSFLKIRRLFVFPIIKLAFVYLSTYYEFDDFGKWHHPSKEMRTYDVKNKILWFNAGKVFNSYHSKYLNVLNKDKPLLNKGTFSYIDLTKDELNSIYGNVLFDNLNSTTKRVYKRK